MKQFFLLAVITIFSVNFATAQFEDVPKVVKTETTDETPTEGPIMTFDAMDIDYGTIAQNSEPLRKLKFENTGTEPLVIKNARGSCGCTVPIWPKEPILPGESEFLEIRYATNRIGPFSKTVTLTTNEPAATKHVIKVHGKVLKEEEQEAVPAAEPSIFGGGN